MRSAKASKREQIQDPSGWEGSEVLMEKVALNWILKKEQSLSHVLEFGQVWSDRW